MSDIKFSCPHCKQNIEAPKDMAGQSVNCPKCNEGLQIPQESTFVTVSPTVPTPTPAVEPSAPPPTTPASNGRVSDTSKEMKAGDKLADVANATMGAAQNIANQGAEIAKRKWKEVGGAEGVKQKAKTYAETVKKGFVPDEGAKGVGQVTSRFRNLWSGSKYGKITIIAVSLILCWLVFGGGNSGSSRSMTKEEWKEKVNKKFPGFLMQDSFPNRNKFMSVIGKPTRTQSVNGEPFWYYQCSDGMIQMQLCWAGPDQDGMALSCINEY